VALDASELNLPVVEDTLGLLLKYQDDFEAVRKGQASRLVDKARTETMERMLSDSPIACN
jgi:hypothetical protein